MSDRLGIANLSGSEATIASRSSFGKANPMTVSSRENARYTREPIRNLTRSRTNASVVRGKLIAAARTSSSITTTVASRSVADRIRPIDDRKKRAPWSDLGLGGERDVARFVALQARGAFG